MSAALKCVAGVLGAAIGAALLGIGCSDDDEAPPPRNQPDASSTGGDTGTGGLAGTGGSGGAVGSGGSGGGDASASCGNSVVEPPEQCDDGNTSDDDACLTSCRFACGDGVKNSVETCDTAITSGPGTCPQTCTSSDSCVRSMLTGSACTAACQNTPITARINGDQCCPTGATSLEDNDCSVSCGNGVLEPGEFCDTAVATGFGACPTPQTCDDQNPCTANKVKSTNCASECDWSEAILPNLGAADGCCPAGGSASTDADCSATCGNGQLDAEETCDPAITADPGVCPTTCADDGNACTREALVTANPCKPTCVHITISQPRNGDGCCPSGANANIDDNCQPVCGNGVKEAGEDCDVADATCSQCKFVPTAFRVTSLTLREPHAYLFAQPMCTDLTVALNTQIIPGLIGGDDEGGADGGGDGSLDLSFVMLFRPQRQVTSPGSGAWLNASCPAPAPAVSCGPGAEAARPLIYNNQATGNCLGVLPGTLGTYQPPPTPTEPGSFGCLVTDETELAVDIFGIPIRLTNARIAAQWNADPANQLIQGLIRGFMSEAVAATNHLPASILGGQPLNSLLPGSPNNACPGVDDRDTGPDGTTRGWWFYFNFVAEKVSWTGP